VSFLIHHLVGKTVNESIINVKKAITEAHRVLKPGGKIVIAESCVSPLFYQFEKLVYPIVSRLIGKVTNHPATIQYPVKMLERMISEEFSELEVTEIPLGRWILIYGIKFPTFLAPVKLRLFVAKK
jgi:ubiquinone/menaquinone biosynthesis C-methylase UbiE